QCERLVCALTYLGHPPPTKSLPFHTAQQPLSKLSWMVTAPIGISSTFPPETASISCADSSPACSLASRKDIGCSSLSAHHAVISVTNFAVRSSRRPTRKMPPLALHGGPGCLLDRQRLPLARGL